MVRVNRPNVNLIIDAAAFVMSVLIVATGFLLEYVLPSGSGRITAADLGNGPGALRHPVLLLWGMTRQEWGDIHFWLAIALLTLLSTHLILHWRWVVFMIKGRPTEGHGVRVAMGVVGLAGLLVLALAPFFSSTVRMSRAEALQQRNLSAPQQRFQQGASSNEFNQQREGGARAGRNRSAQ